MHTRREQVVLRELSEDSRATVTSIAKAAKCSRITAINTMEKLTRDLDLRFTLELNGDRLGIGEKYLVAVKFREKPKEDFLREFFKNDRYAQSVYLVNGKFDLLIYVVADKAVNYIKWETSIAESLSNYGPTIMPSRHVFAHFGYMPMNDSFNDFIGEEQGIDTIDKGMLKVLNANSRATYRELGKRLGISEATARYRLFRLMKRRFITRFTIAAQNPGSSYSSVVYFINYTFTKTTSSMAFKEAKNSYLSDDDGNPTFNTFQLIFPISGSFRSFGMVLGESRKEAFNKAITRHRLIFRKERIRMTYGVVTKCIKGLFPFRSLDIRSDYKSVNWGDAHL